MFKRLTDYIEISKMGAYLSEPVTDIQTRTGSAKGVRYTSCEMQGWRKNMEDSSIA